jgi:hypothetical protein
MELYGHLKMIRFFIAQIKIWLLFLLYQATSKSNGKLMMELFLDATGTQQIIWLFHVEKIVNTEYGINMVDNCTIHHHTIMSLLASNGHQMETTLPLDLLKCLDSAINLDGLIHLTSLNVDQLWIWAGAMMEQLLLELVEMAKWYSETS